MMLFMHGGHKGHNHGNKNHGHHDHHNHANPQGEKFSGVERLDSYKLKQLEGEIQFLKGQNELLQKEVESFTKDVSGK